MKVFHNHNQNDRIDETEQSGHSVKYFNGSSRSHPRYMSSHFFVSLQEVPIAREGVEEEKKNRRAFLYSFSSFQFIAIQKHNN